MWFHKELNQKTVVLLILDGWGEAPSWGGNAIASAKTPTISALLQKAYHTSLEASGAAVGLPGHERGNSEVGHLTIGSGRAIIQDQTRVNNAIENGDFFRNSVLIEAMNRVKEKNSVLHLLGLTSTGGVHSHLNHLRALLELAAKLGVKKVAIHAIADGRDTPPQTAAQELDRVRHWCAELGVGQIVSIVGRYYAMDRDKHWDRIELAYRLFTQGIGRTVTGVLAGIGQAYTQGLTDEYIDPIWIKNDLGTIKNGDSLIMFNFRQDRAREILEAITAPNFNYFTRTEYQDLFVATMIPYWFNSEYPNIHVIFPPEIGEATLGSTIAEAGLRQLRLAETEKYAHITYFLNGGYEKPYLNEDRELVKSKLVESPARQPGMKIPEISHQIVKAIKSHHYSFIAANFASPDMVGHTGEFWSTVTACEIVDQAIARIKKIAVEEKVILLITSDHGNAEQLINPITGEKDPEHTTNPVPFIIFDPTNQYEGVSLPKQTLADIAPTILTILNAPIPDSMTGKSLVKRIV